MSRFEGQLSCSEAQEAIAWNGDPGVSGDTALARHLSSCGKCRRVAGEMARLQATAVPGAEERFAVSRVKGAGKVGHDVDVDEADAIDEFADRVMTRIDVLSSTTTTLRRMVARPVNPSRHASRAWRSTLAYAGAAAVALLILVPSAV